jgi:hypothetical protein
MGSIGMDSIDIGSILVNEYGTLINDKFIFTYNGINCIGRIIYYKCTNFIIVNVSIFERILFNLKINTDGSYYVGVVYIDNNHNLIDIDISYILYYNSVEHQNYLLSNDGNIINEENLKNNDFITILNIFTTKYLNITLVDDIFLNLMYFFLTEYNRTYIMCLCAVNNNMDNFNIILNNIKVDYSHLLYVLQHTFGYLTLNQYDPVPKYLNHIVNKKTYMQHIQNMAYLRYIYPHLRQAEEIFEQVRQLI